MKLHKVLTIGEQVYLTSQDDTRLDLTSPGRASFTLQAEQLTSGLVTFDIGYNAQTLQRLFSGYIESVNKTNSNEFTIFCREYSYVLNEQLPLNLRHCTMTDVVKQIAKVTGLKFRLPEKAYTQTKAAFFYNLANGFYALDMLGDVFNIPDYFWQQQGNGEIFCGSYQDSFFGLKDALQIEPKLFKNHKGNNMATIAPLPGIRPGAQINDDRLITSVILTNDEMVLKW